MSFPRVQQRQPQANSLLLEHSVVITHPGRQHTHETVRAALGANLLSTLYTTAFSQQGRLRMRWAVRAQEAIEDEAESCF
jgi:hypothetical protein